MTEQERTQLIKDLVELAEHTLDANVEDLARAAAIRIHADDLRLKAQTQMAVTLNDTMEEALTALAMQRKWQKSRS